MTMPGRKFSSTGGYRYGFNGKENDKDAGEGIQDYGMRIYDCRLGKFLSVDPLIAKYPWYTPYQFAGNKPINSIDLDGLEEFDSYKSYKEKFGDKAMSEETWDGSDGAWLESDRVNKLSRWSTAMETITRNNLKDRFTTFNDNYVVTGFVSTPFGGVPIFQNILEEKYSFEVVRDYYNWVQHEIESKGMKSEWAKGASYLVDGFCGIPNETGLKAIGIYNLIKDLNLSIATYAIGKYSTKLYGVSSKDGYDFDLDFIREEQGEVAQKVYKQYEGSDALETVNKLASKEGLFSWLGGGMSPYLPNFADFNVDVTSSQNNFGRGGRQHIPLLMLYTSKHAEYMYKTQQYVCTSRQMTQVEMANVYIAVYYLTKMKY
jgi:RHS repeat-associated protein